MKSLLVFPLVFGVLFAQAAANDATWSKPDNGLRGRLIVLPPEKEDSPFCRVFLELEILKDFPGAIKIRYSTEKLALHVTDAKGVELANSDAAYGGKYPLWEEPLILPYASTIKFQISFPGLLYDPKTGETVVDVALGKSWVIPQTGSYFLSGTLILKKESADGSTGHYWSGTLTLPKVEIPRAERTK